MWEDDDGTALYWDGANISAANIPGGSGGSGVWDGASTNWTNAAGSSNGSWNSGAVAIFGFGDPENTVTLADEFTAVVSSLVFTSDNRYLFAAEGSGRIELTGPAVFNAVR